MIWYFKYAYWSGVSSRSVDIIESNFFKLMELGIL